MKYIFFGTPEIAAIVLEHLITADLAPIAIVANPDRPIGRKQVMTPPATKELLVRLNRTDIAVLQPETLDEAFERELTLLSPEFFVVAAYAKIIPERILHIAPQGAIGVHPSLLPKLRGASPIQSAILTGASETGVSLYLMDARMDHGPILQEARLTSHDLATIRHLELQHALAHLAGEAIVQLLPQFAAGTIHAKEQNHAEATITKKFSTEDAYIEPGDLAKAETGDEAMTETIDRKIRALNPEPGTWTIREEKRVKLLAAKRDGAILRLTQIQPEGKRPYEVG